MATIRLEGVKISVEDRLKTAFGFAGSSFGDLSVKGEEESEISGHRLCAISAFQKTGRTGLEMSVTPSACPADYCRVQRAGEILNSDRLGRGADMDFWFWWTGLARIFARYWPQMVAVMQHLMRARISRSPACLSAIRRALAQLQTRIKTAFDPGIQCF